MEVAYFRIRNAFHQCNSMGFQKLIMLGLNLGYNVAIVETSVSLAAMLLALSPVFVVIAASLFLKESLTPTKILCTLATLLGCFLLSGIIETDGLHWTWFGIMAGLSSAAFSALYNLLSKVSVKRKYNAFTITFYSLLFQSLVLIPLTDWNMISDFVIISPVSHSLFMLAHSLLTNIMTYVLFTYSMKYIEAGKATIIEAASEPITALILGILLLNEIPSPLNLLGMAITLLGLIILLRAERK